MIVPQEGGESLFENPTFDNDNERTTYKKGPSSDYFRQRPPASNVNIRPDKYPDYDYNDPYYDQVRGYPDSALPGERGQMSNSMGYDKNFGNYYPTTPPNKYSRTRYRTRYPPSDRRSNGRERSTDGLKTSNRHVKPIAMRDTRHKRKSGANYIENTGKHSVSNILKLNKSHFDFKRKRKRRHVGPHDEDGLQRLLSTGSLVPTLLPKDNPMYNHSIDVVFATYWFFPAKTRAILPEDQHCIEQKMANEKIRFDLRSEYFKLSKLELSIHLVISLC